MGNRFGRNQKRKLMQQLAEQKANTDRLKAAYEMADGLQRHTSEKLDEAKRALKMIYSDVIKHLNPHHPLLPDELRVEYKLAHEASSIRIHVPQSPYGFHIKTAEILRRKFYTEEFENLVSVKVIHGGKVVGYAVDLECFQLARFREDYIKDMSRDIAEKLINELTKQRRW